MAKFNFTKHKDTVNKPNFKKPAADDPGAVDAEYRKRAKAEQDRVSLAIDDAFWIAVCFKSEADRAAFFGHFQIPDTRFISGGKFSDLTQSDRPEKARMGFKRHPVSMAKTPNPLEGVEYSGNLEVDSIREADAILSALKSVQMPDPCKEATDSSIWICVAFESRAACDDYIKTQGISKYGDKYVDGSAWLKRLK